MKWIGRLLGLVFLLAGLTLSTFTIKLAMDNRDSQPQLRTPTDDAPQKVAAVLDAACSGDFAKAEELFYGEVDLGIHESNTELGRFLWQAHVDSLSYKLIGPCHTTSDGLSQKVEITYLRRNSVTASLGSRIQAMLEVIAEEAERPEEVYTEDGEYREDIVMPLVYRAAQDALEQDAQYVTVEVTVNLIYDDGWQVLASDELANALSGGILG